MEATHALAFLMLLLLPAALQQAAKWKPLQAVGTAVLCYLAGIGMGALRLGPPAALTESVVGVSI